MRHHERGHIERHLFRHQDEYLLPHSQRYSIRRTTDTFLRKAIEVIRQSHTRLPNVHLIGWDIAIDETGEPILIEINISYPGIIYEQLCSGPLFGERTGEVIEYVNEIDPKSP